MAPVNVVICTVLCFVVPAASLHIAAATSKELTSPCDGDSLDGLKDTLVVVEQDSYLGDHLDQDFLLKQVHAVERTWGSQVPNILFLIRNDKLPGGVHRTTSREFLADMSGPQGDIPSSRPLIQYSAGDVEGYWEKDTVQWKLLHQEAQKFGVLKWVFYVNLETYVIAPNLCSLLSNVDSLSRTPVLIGRPMLVDAHRYPMPFNSAGQLFSWAGLEQYRNRTQDFKHLGGASLAEAGLFVRDSRDEFGRERFHSFSPLGAVYEHPVPSVPSYGGWFDSYSFYGRNASLECCASTSVSFHYLEPPEHRALHQALKRSAQLRAQSSRVADLSREVFGTGWKSPESAYGGAGPEFGLEWRDPAYTGRANSYNNSLVRELIANQLRVGDGATWDVSRILRTPEWTVPDWQDSFKFDSHFVRKFK